jgi:diguanylate cyclase (GGDEF)-like protein
MPETVRDFKPLFYRKLMETHLFYEVGKTIASELEPYDLVQKVITAVGKAVNFEDAVVYMVRKDMTALEPFYFQGPLFRGRILGSIFFDNGAPGQIAAKGEPLFLTDTAGFEGFIQHPDEDRKVVGIIGLSHSKRDAFRIEDFDLIRTIFHLISVGLEKAELFRKTLDLARVDELTGLLNYRVLLEKLEEEARRQARTGREFSFIMIDIDDFKRINDRYGHLEGSRLLAQIGPVLQASCRKDSTDICFRYGGEEFSILLGETGMEEAAVVAERVRRSVDEYPFTIKALHPEEPVTVSLGVSTVGQSNEKSVEELVHEADIALYRSKAEGKNKVTCYTRGCGMPVRDADPNRG